MKETKRKFPSLPPNYVSLQQLQEQRLRKQQQKNDEEEEEERLKEEEKEKQKEAEEEEEEKKKTQPRIRNRNGRNFSQKSWLIKEKNEVVVQKFLEEVEPKENNEAAVVGSSTSQKKKKNKYKRNGASSEIQKVDAEINVNVVVVEAEELPDHQNLKEIETKKKKKNRYNNKGKKPMVIVEEEEEETLIDEDMKVHESLRIPNQNDAADLKKNTRTGFRRRRDQKPPPESVNQTMEIEQKIGDLKICDDDDDDDDDEKKKSTVEKKKKNYYYSGVMRYGRKKPMDGNLMWIRKDEKPMGFSV